ncbi:MAG: hypothetical protein AAF270_02900 [Pseudomonadota bacterium]
MNRRQLMTVLVASAALAASAASLAARPGGPDPAKQLQRMTESLGLFDDQIPQVEAILLEAHAARQQIGDSYTLNQRAEAREAMRALRDETDAKLSTVLTDEQQARMAELREQRKERRKQRRGKRAEQDTETDES